MDKTTFERLIDSPHSISGDEAELLDELVQAFPYCQSAHLLLAKESHAKKSMLYPNKLKRAATYVLDRRVLHQILTVSDINPVPPTIPLETQDGTINISKHETTLSEPRNITTSQNLALLQELEENLQQIRERKKKAIDNSLTPHFQTPAPPRVLIKFPFLQSESRLGDELTSTSDPIDSQASIDIWLNYLNTRKLQNIPTTPASPINQRAVIENFLDASPQISRSVPANLLTSENKDLSQPSTELKIELVTENFAQILVKQNKISKAKEIYKKLILKFPDKSSYFAAKLNELENR